MKILPLTFLIFLSNITFGQVAFFKDYGFEKGGYYLLGTRSQSDRNELADSLGEWYTDDIFLLNTFKSEWVFTEPGKRYACGYHYVVYLCKNGLALESFAINLNCNEVDGDKGYFYFDYECKEGNRDCLNNEENILTQISTEIKLKYPEEDFELQGRGGSRSEVFVKVKCNKSLEDKFDLYVRHPEYDKWEPFRLYLTTYWIKK